MEEVGAQLTDHWKDAIFEWASDQSLISEVYLYGSYAKGTATSESDVDLALLVDAETDGERWGHLVFEREGWVTQLNRKIPVKIDLQNLSDNDIVVKPAVLEHGILIFRREKLSVK